MEELAAAGHEALAAPTSRELDLGGPHARAGLRAAIEAAEPAAIAHLAGVSFGLDARRDPVHAQAVTVGGTRALFNALDDVGSTAAVLISSSSEVYGEPRQEDLPLREEAPTRASSPYALTKLGQELTARTAADAGRRVIIARAFNHTGPGQRAVFVAPALAGRVLDVAAGRATLVRAGNLDVRRDLGDVRDVVRAYRLLLETTDEADSRQNPSTFNVATGVSVSIRSILDTLCRLAHVVALVESDPTLVRAGDPPDIVGDASMLRASTGWEPQVPLERTLADLLASLSRS